ncbi:MAG: hypothetical protein CMM60_08470 [Rhodospirillaceae bacterium]|nr:hypothetical protein [Rhodospirillaceae bacterium]
MSEGEGRLSRWAKRKSRVRDGAPEAEAPEKPDKPARKSGSAAPVAAAERESGAVGDPGYGPAPVLPPLERTKVVAPMVPLAGPEEGDADYEAPPPEALELMRQIAEAPEPPDDADDREEEAELTPEQQEAVRNLPPIESLTKDSDFTPFLASNVPDFLKRQAFKVLWMSNPFFNFRDGLDDYDENFRLIDKLITAADSDYKPGKGYGLEDKEDEDVGAGEDDGGGEEAGGDGEETAEGDESKRKEPRKSDVRRPDDAV